MNPTALSAALDLVRAFTKVSGDKIGRAIVRKSFCKLAVLGLLVIGVQSARAEVRTVSLSVGMGCPTCPYIVKSSLQDVPGVQDVRISYREQKAIVKFDDEKTTVAALTKATADVGFPSRLIE